MSEQTPVIAVAILTTKPGMQSEFEAAVQVAIPAVHQEGGCLLYALHRQAGADNVYVMVEKWASKEEFRAHGKGAALAELNVALADIMAAAPDVRVLSPIAEGTVELGTI